MMMPDKALDTRQIKQYFISFFFSFFLHSADDLVFVLESDDLVVYDMHSDACLRKALSSNIPNSVIAMTCLGMHVPVETGGERLSLDCELFMVTLFYSTFTMETQI